MLAIFYFVCLVAAISVTVAEFTGGGVAVFRNASGNADRANEGFIRINDYMNGWLAFADPESKLVPRHIEEDDIWNVNDCAADNFPFLVLSSFFVDRAKYTGIMREMLSNEIRLTSRVKSLPDTYSFTTNSFYHDEVSIPRLVFGTTEYIKDGLLPITEWLGESPWSQRMLVMLKDMDDYVDVARGFDGNVDFGNAPEDEVNGELLQVLSRIYWFTGEKKYLDWAVQIGDHFLLGEAYPLTSSEYLRLRDHGCELISGLCDLYVTLHYADREKKAAYQEPLYKLLDYVLEHGRNADGFFYDAINPRAGEIISTHLADTWGYTLNGYYAVYLVDGVEAYKAAVARVFENLHRYHKYNWENFGADGYADAIEGALNLYNRTRDERVAKWIDREMQVMWKMQRPNFHRDGRKRRGGGTIEGWYGDGNFARTSIMYSLWKTKGTHIQPWDRNVRLGAEVKGDSLYIVMRSARDWKGQLYFDTPRHATQMKLPVDWPRINQFPEWFTASAGKRYRVTDVEEGTSREVDGSALINGLEISLRPHQIRRMVVAPVK